MSPRPRHGKGSEVRDLERLSDVNSAHEKDFQSQDSKERERMRPTQPSLMVTRSGHLHRGMLPKRRERLEEITRSTSVKSSTVNFDTETHDRPAIVGSDPNSP